MTISAVRAVDLDAPDTAVPVILGIGLDEAIRRRLAAVLDDIGVVMFTPDVASAHQILCRDSDPDPRPNDAWFDEPVVSVGDLEIDREQCRVTWRGAVLALTKQERDLLAALAMAPVRVWTYRQLHHAAWDCEYTDPGPVRAAVKRLRRKLRHAGVPVAIDAVRGVGYHLVEPGAVQ